MINVMITVLELTAGVVLTGALVTVLAILAALELGRLVSRADEQREVAPAAHDRPRLRAAAWRGASAKQPFAPVPHLIRLERRGVWVQRVWPCDMGSRCH